MSETAYVELKSGRVSAPALDAVAAAHFGALQACHDGHGGREGHTEAAQAERASQGLVGDARLAIGASRRNTQVEITSKPSRGRAGQVVVVVTPAVVQVVEVPVAVVVVMQGAGVGLQSRAGMGPSMCVSV